MSARRISGSLLATPPVNDEIARDPKQVAPPLFLVRIRSSTQRSAKGVLDDVVRISRIARHTVDIRPQRP